MLYKGSKHRLLFHRTVMYIIVYLFCLVHFSSYSFSAKIDLSSEYYLKILDSIEKVGCQGAWNDAWKEYMSGSPEHQKALIGIVGNSVIYPPMERSEDSIVSFLTSLLIYMNLRQDSDEESLKELQDARRNALKDVLKEDVFGRYDALGCFGFNTKYACRDAGVWGRDIKAVSRWDQEFTSNMKRGVKAACNKGNENG